MRPSLMIQAVRCAAALALAVSFAPAIAQSDAAAAPVAKKAAKKKAPKAVERAPEAASAEQLAAADRVYYGSYACEFNKTVSVAADAKYPGYVDVVHERASYLMKPVLSSTGALRLEDFRGEALMVQIASKSMLLNVKTGHRVVDDCVSDKQRAFRDTAQSGTAGEAQVSVAH